MNFRCGCSGITANLITHSRFVCLDNDRAAVSFRAMLHGSPRYSVQFLRDGMEEWLNVTTSSIIIRSIEYNLDAFCTKILDSDNAGQDTCSYPVSTTLNTPDIPTTKHTTTTSVNMTTAEGTSRMTTTSAEDVPFIVIVVGGAAAVLTVLILAVVCGVVICVIVYARSKRPSESLR